METNRYRIRYTEVKPGGHHTLQDVTTYGDRSDLVRFLSRECGNVLEGSVTIWENVGNVSDAPGVNIGGLGWNPVAAAYNELADAIVEIANTPVAITMDIVESGNTIMACKMLGMVPESHEPDSFNLYVRTVGSTVIVSRSDTDEKIVSAVGFAKAMVALANHYMLPVTVQTDPGITVTKKAAELCGTYSPTREDSGFRTLHGGDVVRVGDVVSVPTLPDFEPVEILTFLPLRTIVRGVRSGLLSVMESLNYVQCEIVAKHTPEVCKCEQFFAEGPRFDERVCPCGAVFAAVVRVSVGLGDIFDDVISDTMLTVVAVTPDMVRFQYQDTSTEITTTHEVDMSVMALSVRVRDEDMIHMTWERTATRSDSVYNARMLVRLATRDNTVPVKRCNRLHNGRRCDRVGPWEQCRCVVLVKRPTVKHKSTSRSRARRGGA